MKVRASFGYYVGMAAARNTPPDLSNTQVSQDTADEITSDPGVLRRKLQELQSKDSESSTHD